MVTDQEQRVPGRPSGEPAALLPSPNVLTTCNDERRMAFVNADPLMRILPPPRRCWLDDEDLHTNWYVLTTIVHCIA